jgi:hypothetical protein
MENMHYSDCWWLMAMLDAEAKEIWLKSVRQWQSVSCFNYHILSPQILSWWWHYRSGDEDGLNL